MHALLFFLLPIAHNFNIIINTDYLSSQQVLELGYGKDPVLCSCAKQLWLISAKNNCSLLIVPKSGMSLVLADNLSRSCQDSVAKERAFAECKLPNLKYIKMSFSMSNLDFNL